MQAFSHIGAMEPMAKTKLQKDISKKWEPKDRPPTSESESDSSSGSKVDFFTSYIEE